jgi:hypothetical protein
MIRAVAALLAVAFLAVVAGLPSEADAQAAQVTVVSQDYSTTDPRAVTFEIQVTGTPLAEAVLQYVRHNPDGDIGGEIRAELPSRGTGLITAELTTIGPRAYIPIGTRFTHYWVLTTEGGEVIQTDRESFIFLDGRYDWRLLEDRGVRLYWYTNESRARSVLDASADALAEIGDLLGVEITFPVTVMLWGGGQDGVLAQRPRGGVYDEMSVTGGTRVAPDIVHVYTGLGLSFEDIARHEIGHIVVKEAGDGPFTSVPSWLDEGIATYAQADKGGRLQAVQFAIQTDSTLRLRNMVAATNRPELIDIFYGQSWFVVDFMIEEYGQERMAALMAAMKAGATIDEALLEVYGVDQDGLYNAWRVSVGLPELDLAPVVTGPSAAQPEATRAPLTLPTSVVGGGSQSTAAPEPTESAQVDAAPAAAEGGDNTMTAILVALVAVLLAGGMGALAFRLMRSSG